jgi:hypothetical protein
MTMKRWISGLMLALVTCAHGAALAPAKTVDAAAWMVGRWVDPDGGGETWTRIGQALIGVGWLRSGDGTWNYEVMRVDAPAQPHGPEGVHGLRFTAWPSGQAAAHFAERERGATEVVFAAPEHDFPKVIRYRQRLGGLAARIEGDRPEDGQDFSYAAAPATSAAEAEAADRGLDWRTMTAKVWLADRPAEAVTWVLARDLLASGAAPGGQLAFTAGSYARSDAEGSGDYVFLWRRGEAGWQLELAVFNPT